MLQRLRQVRWFVVVMAAVMGAIIWGLIGSRFNPPGYMQLVFVALAVVFVAPLARKRENRDRTRA
jgi:MFS-type transporter involved in bile tolerance (Atg22 family)